MAARFNEAYGIEWRLEWSYQHNSLSKSPWRNSSPDVLQRVFRSPSGSPACGKNSIQPVNILVTCVQLRRPQMARSLWYGQSEPTLTHGFAGPNLGER